MAFIAPLFAGTASAGGLMSAASTILGLGGAIMQANATNAAAKANQQQLNYQAGQEAAAAQHEAEKRRRQADLVISRAIAVGAASGAGVTGIEGLLAGIAEEGAKSASAAMYEGTERAKGLRYQGAVGVSEAGQKANATLLGAAGSAAGSLYSRFAPAG